MTKIADLTHGCLGESIRIRILRKWVPHYRKYETWYLAVDENGDAIAILGQNAGQKYLESMLQLFRCYKIEKYSCSETPRHQRILKNPTNLNLGPASRITVVEDMQRIPKTWFDFVSIENLYSFIDHREFYPDVLGNFKKQSSGNKKDGDPLLYVTLTDHMGQEVVATLWKECIENEEKLEQNLMANVAPGTPIAITNVRPTVYAGRIRVSSTDATHVIFNPPLDTEGHCIGSMVDISKLSRVAAAYPCMTIQELLSKTHSYLTGKTICVEARITDFRIEDSWFISTCDKCKVRIPVQGKTWFCVSHGPVQNPVFFFNLHATLDDGTQTIQVMVTDAFMTKLTGRTCEQLILEDGYDDRKILPPVFESHKTRVLKLYLEMTRKSTTNKIHFVVVDLVDESNKSSSKRMAIASGEDSLSDITPATSPRTNPPMATPSTDTPQKTIASAPSDDSKRKTSVARLLSFEELDDINVLNPTKRTRYKD